jgi:hypothetical protein
MKLTAIRTSWILATVGLAAAAPLVVDPPDVELNAATGLIETVDAMWSGSNFNVRFTEVTVAGELTYTFLLTSNSANDVDPRIACAANGDLVVVWWRDLTTDALIFRKRSLVSGTWSLEKPLGAVNESSSHPRVVYVGGKSWVVYQIQKSGTRSVGAQIIDDDSEPMRSIVATTNYGGDLDLQITYEGGHLWTTWIDSASRVGYSEYNFTTQLWSGVAVESYGSDSVAAARARIRSRVLGS